MRPSQANQPVQTTHLCNMMMVVLAKTRLFAREYQERHGLPDAQKTLANAFTWWADKVRVMIKYDKHAGNMGRGEEYGMGASTTDGSTDSKEVLEDYALSMQLFSQNAMLQQQLKPQQFAIDQL